jgi:hypothetical protein
MGNAITRGSLIWLTIAVALVPASRIDAQQVNANQEIRVLSAWQGPKVTPVLGDLACHSIHAYFNATPESPDGRHVLLYRSTAEDAHQGEVCVVERSTGEIRTLARRVTVEDAHRVACQQWILDGEGVVFHDLRAGEWVVVLVDFESGREQIVARGRQLGWGSPRGDLVPLYGPHWKPGPHRNLELLNVRTGAIETVATADEVRSAHAAWFEKMYGGRPVSIFFPILSPDGERVFFKTASPKSGEFRSPDASTRLGLFCYDLASRRLLPMHHEWGHPAWHANSRTILNIWGQRLVQIDCDSGSVEKFPQLPAFPGGHPSFSPDGRLFVTDVRFQTPQERRPWGVMVGSFEADSPVLVHRFNNSEGAASWRVSHPHPVFSPDGKRVYFNVSDGAWTRLFVAEAVVRK